LKLEAKPAIPAQAHITAPQTTNATVRFNRVILPPGLTNVL
jgi:hypothetical protein